MCLPARQGGDGPRAVPRQIDHGQELVDAQPLVEPWHAGSFESVRHIVGDVPVWEQQGVLKHQAKLPSVCRHRGEVVSVPEDPSGVGLQQPRDDAQQRRLASTARPKKRNHLARND